MSEHPDRAAFTGSPILAGVIPGQDPAVWDRAIELATSLSAPLIAAFVDPASYLVEWTPGGKVAPMSLHPHIDPDDETAQAAAEITATLRQAASNRGLDWSLRIIGGDPALALGRLAADVGASTIIVGARRPGFMAKVDELVSGSIYHHLLTTQTVPVLGIPSPEVQRHFQSHG